MLDIIIVEDNHEIGELLSDFLRNENYIVSVAKKTIYRVFAPPTKS